MLDKDAIIDKRLTQIYANSFYGKFSPQAIGRAYRPGLWHLMRSDPHDKFDNWIGSHTNWLTADNDPCDEWPLFEFRSQYYDDRFKRAKNS